MKKLLWKYLKPLSHDKILDWFKFQDDAEDSYNDLGMLKLRTCLFLIFAVSWVRKFQNMDTWKHWNQSCATLKVPARTAEDYWEIITNKYGEKQRYYHTLDHVKDMFRHFEDVIERLQQPALVAMAIFFHDVIYEPKEKDNEERSAELYQRFIDSFNDNVTMNEKAGIQTEGQTVIDWILATKSHKTEVHTTPGMYGETDLDYFLDMDMAILGTSSQEYREYAAKIKKEYSHYSDEDYRKEYREYAAKIKKEYSHYSDEDYRKGRAKVLQGFLKIPNIYATKVFRDKYEAQARANIEDEIQQLLRGIK